ncbi:hypothetical protein [Intrasporangium sp.]|uniref:hypothetical protein n=1 Tax=Intrasporangium sp. TaxID=1925024 RepID=UPI003221D099
MYAKTLIPGPALAVPTITATTPLGDILFPQLTALGWTTFGQAGPSPAPGTVHISPGEGLRLIIEGETLLEDSTNPAAPPGWWQAVSALDDRVVVVIVPSGRVDLADPDQGRQLSTLQDEGIGVYALLPLTHAS